MNSLGSLAQSLAQALALAACVLALSGCEKRQAPPTIDPAYARDVDRFCHAERHANAEHIETSARALVVADWLGKNLETPEARNFLASITALSPAEKARRLRAEGAKAKLEDCPSAAAWERL